MELSAILNSNSPVLVCFSGGKDSVAMVLHLLELGVSKDRIHLHHHDVDGHGEKLFDWSCTESYVKAFAKAFDLKLFFSYRKGGIAREIYRNNEPKQDVHFQKEVDGEFYIAPSNKDFSNTRLKFPALSNSMNTRWCSGSVKIDVLRTAIAHNENYLGEIFILTGERRQESTNREKYEQWELHKTNSKSRSAIAFRPILEWTEEMVWDIMKRWIVRKQLLIVMGMVEIIIHLNHHSHHNLVTK
jgi:3'-phosphoadenosine 5'-phosphosulfate sulfotransferase (PAPS reductase)/FAD synthetase